MCRFLFYMGAPVSMASLVTEPANSLIHQSFECKEREEPLNGDGFGVAWYMPEIDAVPAMFKSVTPAWNNLNLLNIARVTNSPCILAHVRAATSTNSVTETNCHPFTWSRYAFCHNGDVGCFKQIRRKILDSLSDDAFNAIHGQTDSEHLFALFIDRIRVTKITDPAEAMAQAVLETIAFVNKLTDDCGTDEHNYLNFAVTDGQRAVISHCTSDPDYADSLHIHTGKRYTYQQGITRMLTPEQTHQRTAVIVASEPLSDDKGWRNVPVNQLTVIDHDLSVTTRAIRVEMKAPTPVAPKV